MNNLIYAAILIHLVKADFNGDLSNVDSAASQLKKSVDNWSSGDGLIGALNIQNYFPTLQSAVENLSKGSDGIKDNQLEVSNINSFAASVASVLDSLTKKAADFQAVRATSIVTNDLNQIGGPAAGVIDNIVKALSTDCAKLSSLNSALSQVENGFVSANSAFSASQLSVASATCSSSSSPSSSAAPSSTAAAAPSSTAAAAPSSSAAAAPSSSAAAAAPSSSAAAAPSSSAAAAPSSSAAAAPSSSAAAAPSSSAAAAPSSSAAAAPSSAVVVVPSSSAATPQGPLPTANATHPHSNGTATPGPNATVTHIVNGTVTSDCGCTTSNGVTVPIKPTTTPEGSAEASHTGGKTANSAGSAEASHTGGKTATSAGPAETGPTGQAGGIVTVVNGVTKTISDCSCTDAHGNPTGSKNPGVAPTTKPTGGTSLPSIANGASKLAYGNVAVAAVAAVGLLL